MAKAAKVFFRNPRDMEIITTQGENNFIEGFELAFEGHRRAKSVFYHLCEDMYYLFLFTIVSLQPSTVPDARLVLKKF